MSSMSILRGILTEAVEKVAEFEKQNEVIRTDLENTLEEAKEAVRASREAEKRANASAELFGPPGYIILYRSSNYGDNTPSVSWFRTEEDADLFIRWCEEMGNEWIEPICGKKKLRLSQWIQVEARMWEEPPEENAYGRTAILRDLEEEEVIPPSPQLG